MTEQFQVYLRDFANWVVSMTIGSLYPFQCVGKTSRPWGHAIIYRS